MITMLQKVLIRAGVAGAAIGVLLAGVSVYAQHDPYFGGPVVVPAGDGISPEVIRGTVFNDVNRNGRMDQGEAGVPGVLVSNGRDWARTDENGRYEIAVRADMDLTIVQPSGWRVPTDGRKVPQFFYVHKPGGTGYDLRFGGLPDTGPAPAEVHFPLIREGAAGDDFSCAVLGDPQTYSNEQLGWFRDSVITDILEAGFAQGDCMLHLGDVVGDDLDLLDRLLEISAATSLPQWLVIGNHDIDFDARTNADKSDSWRRIYGPNYYAFEMGRVLFVALDNVYYPCGPEDAARGRENCEEGRRPSYNGRLTETQFEWLQGLIDHTPEDRLIVLNKHIPFVSFVDMGSGQHQTDEVTRIYDMLEGREALSLAGHTHTIENHAPGQLFEGWTEQTGTGPIPFRHIIAGAASGAWFQGDFSVEGVPMALQRMGAPMGYLHLGFEGTRYAERYVGARLDPGRGQWIGVNTPGFRNWFDSILEWYRSDAETREELPPFSINDLPDTKLLIPADFEEGVWLTANVWAGSAETRVEARLPDGRVLPMERTQQGDGEGMRIGAEWADPFATARQLSVARYAYESRLGEERAQGHELFRGSRFGPSPPMPQRSIADRNMHLWRAALPELQPGIYLIEVESTDRHGHTLTDYITLEVREERPPRYWRHELWE
jgi:calcineurin-like phosphoesterase family protein